MALRFDQIIDYRNILLYEEVTDVIDVNIVEYGSLSGMHHYAAGCSTIYLPRTDYTPETFTHELLHAKIAALGYSIYDDVYDLVLGNDKLCRMITIPLISHIANCLEHLHMHDHYLAMGFDKRKFITDYEVNKCETADLNWIKTHFRSRNTYNDTAIDQYIGRFFSFRCCFNDRYDYTACATALKAIDRELYVVLEKLINEWQKIDLLKAKSSISVHRSILAQWTNGIISWGNGKSIS